MRRFLWLGYAFLFFAAYAALVTRVDPIIPEGLLTIFQSHRVIGEDFLLRPDRPKAVLVGSSLAAMLPRIALKPVYNLAMSGGSSLAGMRLVEAVDPAPQVLFIEANLLSRPADEELLSELLNPVLLRIKGMCDACRAKNQPLTVALSYVSKLRLKPLSEEEQDRLNLTAKADPKGLRRGLAVQLEGSESAVDPIAMRGVLDKLSSQVGELERRGTTVVFVEMPMHPDLIGTPLYRSGLDAAKTRFPAQRYKWISFVDRTYETSDGAHLIYRDARTVAAKISEVAVHGLR